MNSGRKEYLKQTVRSTNSRRGQRASGLRLRRIVACMAASAIAVALGGCGGGGGGGAAPAPAFTIAVAGDIGQCYEKPATPDSGPAKTAALVTPQDAFVLTLGDNVYEYGTPEEFADCFHPTWGAFKDRIRPAIGNHETYTADAAGYFGYFGAQAGPDRLGYYSFDYGGWHFIMLNGVLDDLSTESPQYKWLAADLAKSRDTLCTIAVFHYPYYNSGEKYGSYPPIRPFFEALYNAGVEMALSAHDHLYERFAPQNANAVAEPARGMRQFIVGTGGHEPNKFGKPLPNSEARVEGTLGILRLTLSEGSYSWQFMPVGGGAALDSGRDVCHR